MFNTKISKEELERISGVKTNKCMKCGKGTEKNYYHAINNKTGEYGYLCSKCVDKMELSNKDASKKR